MKLQLTHLTLTSLSFLTRSLSIIDGKQNKLSLSPCPALTLCVCTCSEVKPDVKIKQTVSCFSNEYCEDSPIGKMPVKITENMFCAGLSLESKHTCKVILFPWALLCLFWDTVWGSTYTPSTQSSFLFTSKKRSR